MLDQLYENIGEKIKGWAKWIFIIEALSAIVGGLVLLFNDAALVGFIVLIAGPLVAWVSSWLLYAFGELVEKTCDNERNTRRILSIMQNKEQPQAPKNATTTSPSPKGIFAKASANAATNAVKRCPYCGDIVKLGRCEMCGKEVN